MPPGEIKREARAPLMYVLPLMANEELTISLNGSFKF